ncbi:PucR family transcriptional regulator [Cellulomonas endometrii]|uniref:PucR family transcriptional regulator n=1 Tax=Cellulomonas endometrii TaxID=3036301 RepID=UPI0024AE5FBB|nr:PucR family transcriptional regulator [Cellulomonas endometrii]
MDVRDLLEDPGLGLSVVAAEPDALDRPVTAAYITDLPDPSRFLSTGDVVLTSGLWLDRPDGAATFLGALAQQNVAALIIGLIEIGVIPDEVIATCRARGLTLLTVSPGVSFRQIADEIAARQPGSATGLATRTMRFSRRIADTVSRGGGVAELLAQLGAEFSIGCWVIDETGVLLASAGAAPDRAQVAAQWNAVIARDDRRVIVQGDQGPATITRTGARDRSGFFGCWGDHRSFSDEVTLAMDALVGALRVEMELAGRWRETRDAQVASLVTAIRDQEASPGAISARMRLEGLGPQDETTIVAARVDDPRFPLPAVLEMLHRTLSARGHRVMGCRSGELAMLLVNGPGGDDRPLAEQLTEEHHLLLAGRQLRVGMSDPVSGVSRLNSAIATAVERVQNASGSGPVVVSTALHVQTHRALLRMLGESTRSGYAREVLAPLLSYDERHNADLVGTLRAFLDGGGAWQETARQLHLHTNTLRYRIARIEELTHRDMSTMADRVDLFLAMTCLDETD